MSVRARLFVMMVLQFFIWGAWLPLIFGYLPSLGFSPLEQSLILSAFPVALTIFVLHLFLILSWLSGQTLAAVLQLRARLLRHSRCHRHQWPALWRGCGRASGLADREEI